MSKQVKLSRRFLFNGMAAAGGLALGARMGGPLVRSAFAQAIEKPALVVVYLQGGYNSLFGSANSFAGAGTFGVNGQNQLNLGNGLVVDTVFNALPEVARSKMASVGVNHGISNHEGAQAANFTHGGQNAAVMLAAALGGTGSIKVANAGQDMAPGPRAAVGGVTIQGINDMQATLNALGAGAADPAEPKREAVANGLMAASAMSEAHVAANAVTLASVKGGFAAGVATLKKTPPVFDVQEFKNAYSLGTRLAVRDFNTKVAAAELMVRAGTNVVLIRDDGWDTHGDTDGSRVRQMLGGRLAPLSTFARRLMGDAERNVVIAIMGDFARSLPGSDHASSMTATVMGKYVKPGTTGKMSARVALPAGTPSVSGLWAYLATVLKAPSAAVQAFGGNPHAAITA